MSWVTAGFVQMPNKDRMPLTFTRLTRQGPLWSTSVLSVVGDGGQRRQKRGGPAVLAAWPACGGSPP